MAIERQSKMSDYEKEEFEQSKYITELQLAHAKEIKRMELEITRLETKWTVLLRIPLSLILLPVKMIVGLAYLFGRPWRTEPDIEFWEFMNK